jgi:hypothetical protein
VNGRGTPTEIFDVFLCHNSEDKPAVREIAQMLVQEGIKPWLDDEQIRPGTSWQTALGEQIETIRSAAVFVGQSGVGPWQSEEIQAFLSEFMTRKSPVIPTILPDAANPPELPWTLCNRHRVDFRESEPDPLRQLIWGITGFKSLVTESLVPGEESVSRARFSESRHHPPLAQTPDQDQAAQLGILRRRVKEYWVEGVLRHSLYNEVLIALGKKQVDEFVDAPWKYTIEPPEAARAESFQKRSVSEIYDAAGLLLILGEPGSGKTTTSLDLARLLLDRSQKDTRERVPVVLNLSSFRASARWPGTRQKRQSLAEWIALELSQKYRVPTKIGRLWLEKDYLIPILDGLDEVQKTLQPDWVGAINAFIEDYNPSGLVVCSRLTEYQWLPKRLKLNEAFCLESLSSGEMNKYLAAGGVKLAALREAVEKDSVLQELAQTPLMLSIMSVAFQEAGGQELARQKGDSLDERRKNIFTLYVEQMFQRKGMTSLVFRKEKIIGWLSWLARKMRENSQSVFLVEGLQPSWLGTRAKRVAYETIVILAGGLSFGLSFGLIVGLSFGLSRGLIVGLSFGLLGGLFCSLALNHIALVETISWEWSRFWKRTIPGSILEMICGLIGGLIGGLLGAQLGGLNYGLICGLILWMLVALTNGLMGGFTDRIKVGKASPNQGIKLSLKNSLVVFLITSSLIGSVIALVFGSIFGSIFGLVFGLLPSLFGGLIVGLVGGQIVALNRGGSAVIKHYALRLILWLSGSTPFTFVKFLDHCAKLIFLKKVGGGYIFIHRMLLDYFAELPQSTKGEGGKTESIQS